MQPAHRADANRMTAAANKTPSRPRVFGVIGHEEIVARSLSPAMFAAVFTSHQIASYYVPLGVRDRAVRKAIRSLPRLGFSGVNVTMPFKPIAAEVADTRSSAVELSGVANTLTVHADGRIHADATDGTGLIEAIRDRSMRIAGCSIIMMGAGGVARDMACSLAASGASRIAIWNRTHQHAESLAELLQDRFPALGVEVFAELPIGAPAHMVVSAIPEQSLGTDAAAIVAGRSLIVDCAYRADRQSTLLVSAAEAGTVSVVDGRELLARQGAHAYAIWFGGSPPTEVMARAVR